MSAPIRDAVLRTRREGVVTFGLPAHGPGGHVDERTAQALGLGLFRADVFSPKGIDDRRETGGYVEDAQRAAAKAWGADLCRFSTGGSTQGVQTALFATCRPGDTVLIGANEHKSAYAMVLSMDLLPVPLAPFVDGAIGAEHGVTRDALRRALAAHPGAKAVLVTSPTYFGTMPDIARLADDAHAAGVPLIVDEAWGAHLPFSKALPSHALACGADVTITSLHKSMGALAQGAAVFLRGERVDPDRFEYAWDLLQSSSISSPITASIDGTRAEYEARGEALVAACLARAGRVRDAAAEAGFAVLGEGMFDGDGAFAWDPTKVTLGTAPLGANGFEVEDWITAEHGLYLGLSDAARLQVGIGPGKTDEMVDRLIAALRAAGAAKGWAGVPEGAPGYDQLSVDLAARPSEAFFGPTEMAPLERCAGRVAAELVVPYPPGCPRLQPGQRIEPVHVAFLESQLAMGALVKGTADASVRSLRVVRA